MRHSWISDIKVVPFYKNRNLSKIGLLIDFEGAKNEKNILANAIICILQNDVISNALLWGYNPQEITGYGLFGPKNYRK